MNRLLIVALAGALAGLAQSRAQEAATKEEPSWTHMVTPFGDLRYRHEVIDEQGMQERVRHRIRARLGLQARPREDLALWFRLASGGSDPISTNQTLGDGFSRKALGIDQAYAEWHPAALGGSSLLLGKMTNPFMAVGRNQFLWDTDLTPEGVALKCGRAAGALRPFATIAGFWVAERSQDEDSGLRGGQGGATVRAPPYGLAITGGAGYYQYSAMKGRPPISGPSGLGNTLDGAGSYATDFAVEEVFAEVQLAPWHLPLSLFGDIAHNAGADSVNTGWLIGGTIGQTKGARSWQLGYQYRRLERDAVLGAFADSDFGGGGTDAKGHTFTAECKVTPNARLSATYFLNSVGLASPRTYHRAQLDLSFSF